MGRVLDDARFAPNGGNRQAWHVVVVTSPEVRRALRDLYLPPWRSYVQGRADVPAGQDSRVAAADEFAENLHRVPVHLVVCADMTKLMLTDRALDRPSIVGGASTYPFVQNALLGCRAADLGTALTTMLCAVEDEAKQVLGVPENHAIACLVTVGHTDLSRFRKLRRADVASFASLDRFGRPLPPTFGATRTA